MDIKEAKDYIKNRPMEYLRKKHGIIIKGNENTKCPKCGGNNNSGKFSVRNDGFMKCFSCGFGGDVLDLIADDNGLNVDKDFINVLKIGCEEYGISLDDSQSYKNEPRQQGNRPVPEPYQVSKYYDFTDIILKAHVEVSQTDYFTHRGFSRELVGKYKLGYSAEGYNALLDRHPELTTKSRQAGHYQYVIPVLNHDGTCNYFLVRANNHFKPDKYNKKVRNMKNHEGRNPIRLFNDRYITNHPDYNISTLFIVEGWADALSIEEAGYHALALNSTSNARKFINLCQTYNPKMKFVICLDNDGAGSKTKGFLLGELTRNGYPAAIGDINGSCKDANEFLLHDKKLFFETVQGIAEPQETERDTVYTPVSEIGNAYYMTRTKEVKCISNFIMKPINLIESAEGGVYTMEFTQVNGKVIIKQFKSTVFSSVRQFKQVISRDDAELCFMGTDVDLEHVKIYMFDKYPRYEKKTGMDHIGIIHHKKEWLFIDAERAVNADRIQSRSIEALISIGQLYDNCLVTTEPLAPNGLKELSGRLFRFNLESRTFPIIAWCAACFLKERLSRFKIKMSNLVLHGTAGSGKSDTSTAVIMPIFGMVSEPLSCSNIKEFALLKVCSSNNLFPVILDEYKPAKLGSIRVDLISRTMRSAYDRHRIDRGHADQTVTSYQYRAPIILIGESSTEEKAVKERSIEILFAKADRTAEHTENYMYLKQNSKLLNGLGQALLFQSLRLSDETLLEWLEESGRFHGLPFETRNINGLKVLYMGMKLVQAVYQELGLDFKSLTGFDNDLISDAFVQNMNESLDINGISKSAVEQIIEAFDRMASKNLIVENRDYVINEVSNELQLYLPAIYPEFAKYHREYNLANEVEYLDKNAFTKQLSKTEYFTRRDTRTFKEKAHDSMEIKRKKCFILNLGKIGKRLETDIFKADNDDGFMDVTQEELPFM